jgi:HEAT repeats
LISAAAVSPLGELVAQLLDSADEETLSLGLHVAAQIPLDDCAELLLACLDDRRPAIRGHAVLAVAMLEAERAVPALLARLDDPEPEVCARAARSLVDLGQLDQIAERRMPGELAVGKTRERTAAVRAALPTATVDVASVLLSQVAGQIEVVDEPPLVEALAAVFRARDGLALAAAFVREIPEALPIVALALGTDDDTTPVTIPDELRAELAAVLEPIIAAGDEPGMVALETLARFSLGDRRLVDTIALAAREDGYAQYILAALAHVRLRTETAADLLARWLDDREYLPATLLAAGVAGVAVPVEHRLWDQIRELLALGTHAAAAAYTALANRHRISVEEKP